MTPAEWTNLRPRWERERIGHGGWEDKEMRMGRVERREGGEGAGLGRRVSDEPASGRGSTG
jgi:hypothetical protein